MARPRYSARKRQREISKQQERARKLARKHGRKSQRPGVEDVAPSVLDAEGRSPVEQSPDEASEAPRAPDPGGEREDH